MKYIVLEMQTNADGTVGTIVTQKDDKNDALSTFYSILASAAISSVPVHTAVVLTNNGVMLKMETFDHRESEETAE